MKILIASLCVACLAGGCAEIDDARYPYDAGWRIGVVEAAAPDDVAPGNGCDDTPALAHAVYVRYAVGLRPRVAVVAVPDGVAWHAGQRLRFNIEDCRRLGVPLGADAG